MHVAIPADVFASSSCKTSKSWVRVTGIPSGWDDATQPEGIDLGDYTGGEIFVACSSPRRHCSTEWKLQRCRRARRAAGRAASLPRPRHKAQLSAQLVGAKVGREHRGAAKWQDQLPQQAQERDPWYSWAVVQRFRHTAQKAKQHPGKPQPQKIGCCDFRLHDQGAGDRD